MIGPASDYNVFVFHDMNVWTSHSQGRVAAGGNISMSGGYSVGLLASPADYSMVSGRNVYFGPGTVFNGGVFAGGNIQLKNYGVRGDVTANGTINKNGSTITGKISQNAADVSPIDFASAYSYLSSTSLSLAAMAPTGITYVSP